MDLLKKFFGNIKNKIKKGFKKFIIAISPKLALIGFVMFIIIIVVGTFIKINRDADNDVSDFSSGSSDEQWEQLIRFVSKMEGGQTIYQNSKGEDCYKVLSDGGASYAAAGIDMIAHGSYFSSLGYSTSIGSLIPADVIESFKKQELEGNYDYAKNKFSSSGINLTQYQLFAFASRGFNCGDWGSFNYCDEDPVSAYKNYWNQSKDDKFKKTKEPDLSHKLYTTCLYRPSTSGGTYLAGLALRREAEFRLFQCGWYKWYDMMDEQFIEESSGGSGGGNIIASAKKIHKYMEENHYEYCTFSSDCTHTKWGHGLDSSFEASKNGHHNTCCATYVSWVLIDAGLINTCVHHCGTESGIGPVIRATGKFQELDITSLSQLKAGDIMWYPNQHVEICAGNGKIYNAGYGEAVHGASPYSSTRCPSKAFRLKAGYSGGGSKISSSGNGWNSVYKSSITGKTFKEFKQNGNYSYPSISGVGCSWGSECGTVSTMIVGSGYDSSISLQTGADLLKSTGGSTSILGYMNKLSGQAATPSATSVSRLKYYLQKGYVGVIHNPGYSNAGHYLAILDINSAGTQVYISNPDVGGASGGWNRSNKARLE